jgi:hypothetical protein
MERRSLRRAAFRSYRVSQHPDANYANAADDSWLSPNFRSGIDTKQVGFDLLCSNKKTGLRICPTGLGRALEVIRRNCAIRVPDVAGPEAARKPFEDNSTSARHSTIIQFTANPLRAES